MQPARFFWSFTMFYKDEQRSRERSLGKQIDEAPAGPEFEVAVLTGAPILDLIPELAEDDGMPPLPVDGIGITPACDWGEVVRGSREASAKVDAILREKIGRMSFLAIASALVAPRLGGPPEGMLFATMPPNFQQMLWELASIALVESIDRARIEAEFRAYVDPDNSGLGAERE
jgi:hypothetical protein